MPPETKVMVVSENIDNSAQEFENLLKSDWQVAHQVPYGHGVVFILAKASQLQKQGFAKPGAVPGGK